MSLNPNRMNILNGKHIALKAWEKRARRALENPEMSDKYKNAIKMVVKVAEELDMLANTTEEQGRAWGWWV